MRDELKGHKVVSQDEWISARKELLKAEKEHVHRLDALSAQRRELPWVKVEKNYVFEGPNGKQTLSDLFEGRSQLITYHFMFGPDWEEGCHGCSFLADHFDGANLHLAHHDVSLVAISRAPYSKLAAFQKRMGWHFKWLSSGDNDFNFDYHVSFTKEQLAKGKIYYNFEEKEESEMEELPGGSVFYKDKDGAIYHTYSSYARGLDALIGAHNFLDLTPKGRNEETTMDWVRH
ncbi:MAG: thioredoxin family protein, partial [Chthoniobacterales bacterium]